MSEKKVVCPICQNTGFKDGKICVCIGPKKDAGDGMVEFLRGMFGMEQKHED